jgi:predicted pyridoxine 5'-phosphate oxidase superfamily flavin-nucleotide-binding protein
MKELKIPEDVVEILESPSSIKMIGTVDGEKNVNLDHVNVVRVVEKNIIAFACSCQEGKTVDNIKNNRWFSLAVFEPDMIGFQLKGTLKEIVECGELFDCFSSSESKPAGVVKIRVTEIYALTMAIAGERVG